MKLPHVRLLVLLAVLGLAVGLFAYDYLVAAPGSEKAFDDLEAMAAERESQSATSGGLVHSADVQKVVGFAPTFTQIESHYTVEWYCWWGRIPVLNTWKRYITVVYAGNEPRFYSTHHKNEPPPEEFLPKFEIYDGPTPGPVELPKPLGLVTRPDANSPPNNDPTNNDAANNNPANNNPAKNELAKDDPTQAGPPGDQPPPPGTDKPD